MGCYASHEWMRSIPTPADHCVALLVADDILREDINI